MSLGHLGGHILFGDHLTGKSPIIKMRLGKVWAIKKVPRPFRHPIQNVKVVWTNDVVIINEDHPFQSRPLHRLLLIAVAIKISGIAEQLDFGIILEPLLELIIGSIRAAIVRNNHFSNPRVVDYLFDALAK